MIENATKINFSGYKLWLKISVLAFFTAAYQASASQLHEDMLTLTSPAHAGRSAGKTDTPNISGQYIYNRFEHLNLETKYQAFPFKAGFFRHATGHNIIATLPCNTQTCGNNLVITAHYDHLGGQPTSYYAGANDNASGTSALLYLAELLNNKTRNRSVTFVATDAEEKGLYGAKYFVSQLKATDIALNINLDMLAPTSKNRVYVLHSKHTSNALSILKTLPKPDFNLRIANSRYKMQRMMDNPRIDWHRASDHYAFAKARIPYIYFGIGEDKNHHTKRDTITAINFERYQLVVNFISDFIVKLLDSPLEATN
ncbi:M28 family peptidase [Pseudoalteromonas aurantia]|nr:M28 family peptidase [Pseudoalteromonas aurantia]